MLLFQFLGQAVNLLTARVERNGSRWDGLECSGWAVVQTEEQPAEDVSPDGL